VTHSIPEAIRIGTRILLLTPHPGQARAELDCPGFDKADVAGKLLSEQIHELLFAREAAAGAENV
jgi:NitT/TauT family transport system ATP-binding protein